MSGNPAGGSGSHGHRSLRLAAVFGVVVLLAILGTYTATEMFGPSHSPTPSAGQNRTVVIYDNSTVFRNTTHNVTTPVYHNSTVWQNSTVYENGTIYRTTTVYVNTTTVVEVPVVNVTGITWTFNSTSAYAGAIGANLLEPDGLGFVHSYPLGTVMWIVVNVTNNATLSGHMDISAAWPFEVVDSQPSVPRSIAAESTMTVEVSIGVPYSPGQYSLGLTVSVT